LPSRAFQRFLPFNPAFQGLFLVQLPVYGAT